MSSDFIKDYDTWTQLTISPNSLHVAFHVSGGHRKQDIDALTQGTTPDDPIIECQYNPDNYSGSIAFWAGCTTDSQCGTTEDLTKCLNIPTDCGGRAFRMNSGYQSGALSDDGIKTILHYMLNYQPQPCLNASLQLDTLGGKINEVEPTSTAFPHRDNTFTYQFISHLDFACDESQMTEWLASFFNSMTPYMSNGSYRNYANPSLNDYNQRYFMENYMRLVDIKGRHDPNNTFHYSQSISAVIQEIESVLLRYWPCAISGAALLILLFWALHHFCSNRQHHHEKQKQATEK